MSCNAMMIDTEVLERAIISTPMTSELAALLCRATCSPDYLRVLAERAIDSHLILMHAARLRMIQSLLPPARIIVDLGGANAPLYRMGYPHQFDELTLVDLPPEDRRDEYRRAATDIADGLGRVRMEFRDMTDLSWVMDGSVDLVWSGQSIEHVSATAARQMCREAFRILRRGGWFCLDTPNALISSLHAATANLEFIHPEHRIEYRPDELRQLLQASGFEIDAEHGLCDMPETTRTGVFNYRDFVYGAPITSQLETSYIQFYRCVKP